MKRFLAGLCVVVSAVVLSPIALAAERVALVIGNADYEQVGALANPVNDARAMGQTLRSLGFDVVEGLDLDRAQMQSALRDFLDKLDGAEVGLFYYAGHGVQVEGENHLIPTDARIEGASDLALASIPLSLIRKRMADTVRVKLIILDACRDNPFKSAVSGTRAIGLAKGLAPVQLSDDVGGAFVAFATDPGAYAQDGLGKDHSPFTRALLDNIVKPGMELHAMMIDVRADVWQATGESQRPWSNSSLTGKFYFSAPQTARTVGNGALDLALWQAASTGNTAAEYRAYLASFPEGTFAGIARSRLGMIAQKDAPVAAKALSRDMPVVQGPSTPGPAGPETTGTEPAGAASGAPGTAPSPEGVEAGLELARDTRLEIQRIMQKLGLNVGEADGVFGEQTRTAIRSWQWSEEFPATGYLSGDQIALMRQHASTSQSASLSTSPKAQTRAVAARATAPPPQHRRDRALLTSPREPAPVRPPKTSLIGQAWEHIGENLQAAITGPAPDPALQEQLRRQRETTTGD